MEEKSPAYKLLEHVWRNALKTTRHSWERLNHSMADAMCLAIYSGMKFDTSDIDKVSQSFRMGYWGDGERFYTRAVKAGNISACHTLEKYLNRKPFIAKFNLDYWNGDGYMRSPHRQSGRICVGCSFAWDGDRVTVTSFADDGSYFIACSYQPDNRSKVKKMYRVTLPDLRKVNQAFTDRTANKPLEKDKSLA